jgi:hypothetical protein
MTIETKYNIGDEVVYLNDNKIKEGTIRNISILVYIDNEITIQYKTSNGVYVYEQDLFPTKEELLKSL